MSTSNSSGKPGINTLTDRATHAWHRDGRIYVRFASGHELSFPVQENPRLNQASEKDLDTIELSPFGIHWPTLNEDLSFEGILAGRYGQKSAN